MGRVKARIGTAGWALPQDCRDQFPAGGSQLQRYAGVLDAVEINSTFYRSHRPTTYQRWAASVPDGFRFSLKLPKTLSHVQRLLQPEEGLQAFLAETSALGAKRSVLLLQLPPSLAFDLAVARNFFTVARDLDDGPWACEPRHGSWFSHAADDLLTEFRVARVAADPCLAPGAEEPGGCAEFSYHRLHGSPRVYYSSYESEKLQLLATSLSSTDWCIFDNTASGAATGNALELQRLVRSARP